MFLTGVSLFVVREHQGGRDIILRGQLPRVIWPHATRRAACQHCIQQWVIVHSLSHMKLFSFFWSACGSIFSELLD